MKKLSLLSLFILTGCSSTYQLAPDDDGHTVSSGEGLSCLGTTVLPAEMSRFFDEIKDPELLAQALGEPGKGKLCQGKVYQSKPGTSVPLFRAWNSTNPNSKTGQWWAFYKPAGDIAVYRHDYEICYQWSPLDKMSQCHLKAGTKVVVGTGQSAVCSEYLTYPVSAKQQVFITGGSSALSDCIDYTGVMSWR
ncbi:hypothetical protein VA7868_03460 [Vibrio aerogenes CECT 7868]|uniref:Lipoprotein n=1 Tax=Vibrio aerogenes CECT 7868 TaxID=1216006 RepID=A0A1M6A310_9VIBR|nr:hypothetical protein [Vibrio aerogenes]SHI30904.1 hypothetical protein VA7868_03460 [Vibrio aerogenes CECT 7868]